MESKATECPDVHDCETGLDANWNERKHLIDREFELRLKIQELLIAADPSVVQVREEERTCKASLLGNDEEYESLVRCWTAQLFPAGS